MAGRKFSSDSDFRTGYEIEVEAKKFPVVYHGINMKVVVVSINPFPSLHALADEQQPLAMQHLAK